MDEGINGWMDAWIMEEWVNKWMSEWVSDWVGERGIEWVYEWDPSWASKKNIDNRHTARQEKCKVSKSYIFDNDVMMYFETYLM